MKDKIVLFYDENAPRNQQRIAKRFENINIEYGAIISARVKYGNERIVTRPVNRLYSLEVPMTVQYLLTEPPQHHLADPNLQAESSSGFISVPPTQ